jgi:hypothetical protein
MATPQANMEPPLGQPVASSGRSHPMPGPPPGPTASTDVGAGTSVLESKLAHTSRGRRAREVHSRRSSAALRLTGAARASVASRR